MEKPNALKSRIELIMGPMGGGKTTELLRRGRIYSIPNRRVAYIKPRKDSRDGGFIRAHDGEHLVKAVQFDNFSDVRAIGVEEVIEAEVICIDEGQFFDDLVMGCEYFVMIGKVVVVAALSGDVERKPFPVVSELISHCDRIDMYTAQCQICGDAAPFTAHETVKSGEVHVGDLSEYKPLCRKHYESFLAAIPLGDGYEYPC